MGQLRNFYPPHSLLMDQQWNHSLLYSRHINNHIVLKNVDHQNYLDVDPKNEMFIFLHLHKMIISRNNK